MPATKGSLKLEDRVPADGANQLVMYTKYQIVYFWTEKAVQQSKKSVIPTADLNVCIFESVSKGR